MKVLVCGGRLFQNRSAVFGVLDMIHKSDGIDLVIHGCALGADAHGAAWAKAKGIPVQGYPADWSKGKSAGPERNAKMLAEAKPDFVVAFPGGTGTADMVRRAKRADVTVLEVSI